MSRPDLARGGGNTRSDARPWPRSGRAPRPNPRSRRPRQLGESSLELLEGQFRLQLLDAALLSEGDQRHQLGVLGRVEELLPLAHLADLPIERGVEGV